MMSLTVLLPTLQTETVQYVNPGKTCRLVGAYTAVNTALTTAKSAITISDGTTTVGAIEIAHEAAVGTCDSMTIDSTSLGKVEFSPTTAVKISNDGGPDAGAANLTLIFDEFAGGI